MPHFIFEQLNSFWNKLNPRQTLRFSMLGPSGVGKTSMLAAIYDQLGNVISGSDIQLDPVDPLDAKLLAGKVLDLRRMFNTDDLIPDHGIEGDRNYRIYPFKVSRRGRKATLFLEFIDYPGGWIEGNASLNEIEWVQSLLRDSDAIMIPIDTPALMERGGQWHHERNRPDFIYDLIQRAYEEMQSTRLIILAPIRCELYLQNQDVAKIMVQKVEKGYNKLLAHLAHSYRDRVAVVMTPMQTLGEIVFHKTLKSHYSPIFMKMAPDAQYSPHDTEQPLRFLLRYAMRLHHDERQNAYFKMIRNMFQNDDYLIRAAETFAAGCKTDEDAGFKIIQGHGWLDIRRRSR